MDVDQAQPQRLAPSVVARWVWRSGVDRALGVPVGAVIEHRTPLGRHCSATVLWARRDEVATEQWTLVSLVPLEVSETIGCPTCGSVGRLTAGQWRQA